MERRWAKILRFRDLVISEDLVEAGWERWETRRKLKRRENHPALKKRK